MYEEPYRWIEAVGNRRHYLDEQFTKGTPVVASAYADGILMLTASRGTPKLYEIYDRIALGGMGHPADLEKLRFSLLEMAHIEGFNRSPSDVTGARLMKYGLDDNGHYIRHRYLLGLLCIGHIPERRKNQPTQDM